MVDTDRYFEGLKLHTGTLIKVAYDGCRITLPWHEKAVVPRQSDGATEVKSRRAG